MGAAQGSLSEQFRYPRRGPGDHLFAARMPGVYRLCRAAASGRARSVYPSLLQPSTAARADGRFLAQPFQYLQWRGHVFGNFHDMVQASAKHPAMLQYLDNYANEAGGFNENYARELYELHTLGAINYLGNTSPLDAPTLPTNPYAGLGDPLLDALQFSNPTREIQSEYTDDDVYEAARALTGWRYDDENVNQGGQCVDGGSGAFFVNEGEHDGGGKAILSKGSVLLPADGSAVHDGEVAIKLAAYHPGTARYIALKLCQRLIAADPPDTLVQA